MSLWWFYFSPEFSFYLKTIAFCFESCHGFVFLWVSYLKSVFFCSRLNIIIMMFFFLIFCIRPCFLLFWILFVPFSRIFLPNHLFWIVTLQWNINRLCFEFDTEPYAQQRDTNIKVQNFFTFLSFFSRFFTFLYSHIYGERKSHCPSLSVQESALALGVEVFCPISHTIFNPEQIIRKVLPSHCE